MSWLHSQQSNFVFTVPILLEDTVYLFIYLFIAAQKSFMLIKAAFIWSKILKKTNIEKYYDIIFHNFHNI